MKKLWLWSQNFFGRGMKQFMNQSSAINISLLCFMNQRAEHVRSSDRHLIKEALLSSQGHNDQKQTYLILAKCFYWFLSCCTTRVHSDNTLYQILP